MLLVSIALPCATPRVSFRTIGAGGHAAGDPDSPLHCEATRTRASLSPKDPARRRHLLVKKKLI